MNKCNPFSFGCKKIIELDDSIASLVFILNFIGIRTKASCHGHLDDFRYPFPWVCVYDKDYERLSVIIKEYNKKSNIEWKISLDTPTAEWILRPRKIDKRLIFLQKEADSLAGYLSRRLLKKECLA
ncbi:MAG: hypothetical protein ACQEP3_00340 [Patescibacteria group bacterium]